MIIENGIELRTEAQWAEKHRAVLKRQRNKGVRREWYITQRKTAEAVFYREDQTRPFNQRELRRARKKKRDLERTAGRRARKNGITTPRCRCRRYPISATTGSRHCTSNCMADGIRSTSSTRRMTATRGGDGLSILTGHPAKIPSCHFV